MNEFIYYSNGAPMADASGNISLAQERIVRCKDCRYYAHNSFYRCDLYAIVHEVEPNGFCAWGEKAVKDESDED